MLYLFFAKTNLQHWVPVNRDAGRTPLIYFLSDTSEIY